MISNNRIILRQTATLTDLTVALNDFYTGSSTIPIIAATDALYVGSDLPFNHRWIEVGTVNALSSVVSVSLWNGANTWIPAVDVMDQTAVTGKALAQSGILSWTPDIDQTWDYEKNTKDMTEIDDLRIYNLYWARLTFSADLTPATAISYVGYKFSDDIDLAAEYPDLGDTALMNAYETGKTNWKEQEFLAAEYVIQSLREMRVIVSSGQILDWKIFKSASVHKTAEIIYRGLGKDFKEDLLKAQQAYKASIQIKAYNVDNNRNARIDERERTPLTDFLIR